jgi:predicted aconitase with swiveling domain
MALTTIGCKGVIKGKVTGEVLFSRKPLSFIGGVDPKTGIILDPLSDQCGQSMADKILVFPFGKGSSGAGLVLLELARVGKAPKALVNLRTNTVLLTGPLVMREFYKKEMPVVCVDEAGMESLSEAGEVTVDSTAGEIVFTA